MPIAIDIDNRVATGHTWPCGCLAVLSSAMLALAPAMRQVAVKWSTMYDGRMAGIGDWSECGKGGRYLGRSGQIGGGGKWETGGLDA